MLLDYYPGGVVGWVGGWVGGLTLTIKLISAQLSYAAAGAGLNLAIGVNSPKIEPTRSKSKLS